MPQETEHSPLGARFHEIRNEFRFTQADFAVFLGVDQSQISHIEKGRSSLSLEMADKIITRLHVSYDWLFHGAGPKFKRELHSPSTVATKWRGAVEVVDGVLREKGARERLGEEQVSLLVTCVAQGVTPELPLPDIRKVLGQLVDRILAKAQNKGSES